MAPGKDGGRTRRKASAGRDEGKRVGRTVEKAAKPARDLTMVEVDPWGSFFEKFWEQAAEDKSADQPARKPKPAKAVRTTRTKPSR